MAASCCWRRSPTTSCRGRVRGRDRPGAPQPPVAAVGPGVTSAGGPGRRRALPDPPPATIGLLVYGPLGIVFDVQPEDVEWASWSAERAARLSPVRHGV